MASWRVRLAALAFGLAALLPGASHSQGRVHHVVIEGMAFRPSALRVHPGDTIIWHNKDIVPHTVTDSAAGVDSADIAINRDWSFTAGPAGTIRYKCSYHPMMKGEITVVKRSRKLPARS